MSYTENLFSSTAIDGAHGTFREIGKVNVEILEVYFLVLKPYLIWNFESFNHRGGVGRLDSFFVPGGRGKVNFSPPRRHDCTVPYPTL